MKKGSEEIDRERFGLFVVVAVSFFPHVKI